MDQQQPEQPEQQSEQAQPQQVPQEQSEQMVQKRHVVCAQATAAELAWARRLQCPRHLRGPVSGQPAGPVAMTLAAAFVMSVMDACLPELGCLKVVVRVAADHEVAVPESQVPNLAPCWENLAMGPQVLQSAESAVAAYSAVVDLEAACPHRQRQPALRQVLEAVSPVEEHLLDQVSIVLEVVSAPESVVDEAADRQACCCGVSHTAVIHNTQWHFSSICASCRSRWSETRGEE